MAARTSAILGLLKKTLQGLPFRVGARCLAGEERGCILSNGEGESIFFYFFFRQALRRSRPTQRKHSTVKGCKASD